MSQDIGALFMVLAEAISHPCPVKTRQLASIREVREVSSLDVNSARIAIEKALHAPETLPWHKIRIEDIVTILAEVQRDCRASERGKTARREIPEWPALFRLVQAAIRGHLDTCPSAALGQLLPHLTLQSGQTPLEFLLLRRQVLRTVRHQGSSLPIASSAAPGGSTDLPRPAEGGFAGGSLPRPSEETGRG